MFFTLMRAGCRVGGAVESRGLPWMRGLWLFSVVGSHRLGCSGEAVWAQPVKEEGLGHKANDCPQLTRLLGAGGEMVN